MNHISIAVPSDAPAISKLLQETWIDTYSSYLSQATLDEVYKNWQSVEFLTRQIKNPEMYFPVIKENNKLIGIATARMPEDTIVIFRIYVLPEHQRKGIGKALISDVIKHFPQAKKVQLYVDEMNSKGQAFYKKHDFKEIRRVQEKVVSEVIHQILLEKEL